MMGCFDGAEICELVGESALVELSKCLSRRVTGEGPERQAPPPPP